MPGFHQSELPLAFEVNQGQADPRIRFLCSMPGVSLYLTSDGAILSLNSATASLRLAGASRRFEPEALDRLPGLTNYLVGNDRSQWLTGIAQYGRVQYRQAYPGIDVIYYGNGRKLNTISRLLPEQIRGKSGWPSKDWMTCVSTPLATWCWCLPGRKSCNGSRWPIRM